MPGSSSTSFIPKHTPNKGERKNNPRQLFIGTLLVRILFFATLISAIGLYFYVNKLNTQLSEVIGSFKSVASTYDSEQDDVDMVTSLDRRLAQANERFKNGASLNALILAIEKATLSTVQFTDLQINRTSDSSIELAASLRTDGFDSVIFQRELLNQSDELKKVEVKDVSIQFAVDPEDPSKSAEGDKEITFQASIEIDPSAIRSVVITDGLLPPPTPIPDSVVDILPAETSTGTTDGEPSVGVELSNQENI
jgi:hypothetical protein